MQVRWSLLLAAFSLLFSVSISAKQTDSPQQASQGSSQPLTQAEQVSQGPMLLQQSLAALTGGTSITDVTLSGTITVTKGTMTESGTITLIAVGDTQGKLTLVLPSGTTTEIRTIVAGKAVESWTGPDRVTKYLPTDSLLTPHAAWFFPAFAMAGESSIGHVNLSVDSEAKNGATVEHLTVLQNPSPGGPFVTSQTWQHDLYLDPASSLPVALDYNTRVYSPDPALRAISHTVMTVSQEIRFSNYQQVQGWIVPFHIQVYQRNRLYYDITLSSATMNTGATITLSN